jgi:iron complex outermembrane receptor protein/vitamin B12 transporter
MFLISRKLQWTSSFVFAFAALTAAEPLIVVSGTVSDPSGAVVPNAKVELVANGVPVASVTSDTKGQYHISKQFEAGLRVRVSNAGFSSAERPLNPAGDAGEIHIDFALQLATFSEQITVTSTGVPIPQGQLGASVTVLSPNDYAGMRDLQEGLRYVPGLQATQVGQAGGSTALDVRGGGSDASKVLLDGIPVNDIGGNVEFANLSSAAIAQAEVLRGPNSVLFGSDALAGVVSLTTSRGSTPLPLLTYQADGGNFGTYRQEGSLGGQHNQFDYFSDFTRYDTSNSIAYSKFHNGTFAGSFGWALSPVSSVRATIHHDQLESGQPSAVQLYGIASDSGLRNEDSYFGITWEGRTNPNWNNLIRYGGVRLRSNFIEFAPTGIPQYDESGNLLDYLGAPVTITGANGYSVSGQAFYQYAGSGPNASTIYPNYAPGSTDKDFIYAQSDYRFNPHVLGLVAFRYEDERGYSYGKTNSVERGNYSYTFELQGDLKGRLFYTLGGGLEDNGEFGFAATPRASLAWQAASGTKLRASFGKGIKEPAVFDQLESLYQLLVNNSLGSVATQDHISPIGPENSRSYDGGVDQYLFGGRTRLSLSLFQNEFSHGIEYVPPEALTALGIPADIVNLAANAFYGATVNTKSYRAQGVEGEVESRLARDFFVRAGYSYLDAQIQHSFTGDVIGPSQNPLFPGIDIGVFSPLIGARPFRQAPHSGYFQGGYRHAKMSAALRGTLVGRRDDSDFLEYDANGGLSMLLPNRNLDAAYRRLDLTTNYQASRHVAVEGSFQNLFSEHYNEAFGYPALPFTFRMGFKFAFGGESWPGK